MTTTNPTPPAQPGHVEALGLSTWRTWLAQGVDSASVQAFRTLFGALVAISAGRLLAYGWVDRFLVEPTHRLTYWGFGWLPRLGRGGMYAVVIGLLVLGAAVAFGYRTRLSAGLMAIAFAYLQLSDASLYLNHYYLVGLVACLLAVLPIHAPTARVTVPRWCLLLLRFQVAVVYVYAGLAKLTSDWLLHAQPLNIWLNSRVDMPIIGPLFGLHSVALLLSWAGFLFDLTIVFWLSWRRTRPVAYAVLLVFHGMTHLLFNIGMFPLIMSVAALIFFSPSWPRHLATRLNWRSDADATPTPTPPSDPEPDPEPLPMRRDPLSPARLLALAAFAVWQLAMPLRHHLYGGNVLWHEQGMRFSWKVKVRTKNGSVTYLVQLPDGRRQLVVPSAYLKNYQEREMSGQPDLILQLAHQIGHDQNAKLRAQGKTGSVEVRVDARVSLNGRPAAPLIDPSVDLMKVSGGLSEASWILPAPTADPPRLNRGLNRGFASKRMRLFAVGATP